MKTLRVSHFSTIGWMLLVASGCEVHIGTYAPPAPPPPPPRPIAHAPAPRPAPMPFRAAPRPAPLPQHLLARGQAQSARRISTRGNAPLPVLNVPMQLDLAALPTVSARMPKGCGPVQVAPGVYVHVDCHKYKPISVAKLVHVANKMSLFKAGRLRLDPRSPGAAAPALSPAEQHGGVADPQELPGTVDHRAQGIEGPVKDQGVVGSCTAFSLSTVMDNAIRRLNKNDETSSLHVWSHYGEPDMDAAGQGNMNHAITVWSDYPYDQRAACRMEHEDDGCGDLVSPHVQPGTATSDPTIQSQIKAADAKGHYKIAEIDQLDSIDPDVLATDLATGKDVWIAMGVGMSAWGGAAVQRTFVIPDYEEEDGGHAIVLAGYRQAPGGRQFLIHNSWSESWGDKGYAWISQAMIAQHVQSAYTIKVVDSTAPPPPPTPLPTPSGACAAGYVNTPALGVCEKSCKVDGDCGPGGACVNLNGNAAALLCIPTNPLTDDDCGETELVDSVTGLCAQSCPDGSRAADAKCH